MQEVPEITPNTRVESPAERLARSVFGFVLLLLIPAGIALIWLLLAPPSPDQTLRSVQVGIQIGMAVIFILLIGLAAISLRTSIETFIPMSRRLQQLFSHNWLVVLFIGGLLELNIFAFLILSGIAPSMVNPGLFLMAAWSLMLFAIVVTLRFEGAKAWFEKTRGLWLGTGMMVGFILLFGVLLVANNVLLDQMGWNNALRGGLDPRDLAFFDDGQSAPSSTDFFAEQAQTRLRWSPYTYWVVDTFSGDYINVTSDGLRATPYDAPPESARIFFFGGSTVWGDGARDAYTIPGHVARLLNEAGTPQQVFNFGQTGYVSTQDLLWFQFQLLRGNVPDVVIFYQGFNDVLSSWRAGVVGVTLQEETRYADSEAGRQLRAGQAVLQTPNLELRTLDLSQIGGLPTTPETITDHWFANMLMIEQLAEAYGVEVLFVWQPAMILKENLTEAESSIFANTEQQRPGLFDLYREVDTIVQTEAANHTNLLLLSDLFAQTEETVFFDLVHITEVGNAMVAESLLPHLVNLFD